jgi:hypothetical protein
MASPALRPAAPVGPPARRQESYRRSVPLTIMSTLRLPPPSGGSNRRNQKGLFSLGAYVKR